jgi:3-oxoacyl-[acyl-carrier-protein] synthase III
MKTNLAVIGQGAVTPAGVGLEALLHGSPTETLVPEVSRPERQWPVYKINTTEPALQRWQKEPRLRRASPLTYFLVEAAEQALTGLDPSERAQTGLVVAFSTGCLAYSRRFFESIVTQGQKSASPALFPETVFNSPVSHVAATLRLEGAAYALVGDETAWIAALKTAWLWLEQDRVKQVLVMGAEEFDSSSLDAYRNARWLKRQPADQRFIPAEGAGGVLVRKAQPGDALRISQLKEGYIYRSKVQALAAGRRCLEEFDTKIPCYLSAQHSWLRGVERNLMKNRTNCTASMSSNYLGEAITASATWNAFCAFSNMTSESRMIFPVWGSNHQIGALQIDRLD